MDDQKKQIIDKLKQANNVLVTVRTDPTIDQLAACIGLTLVLNELGKHATAVFSGAVPSVLEFLEPEKTLESDTNSLRDFIISLDKSKADKLRYKVEDKVVKIFITPYKTSISDADLEFSQGDFNVDVVVALGVHEQNQLDEAITQHGAILHDATVMSITTDEGEKLGSVNWFSPEVSSLSEMVASIADQLGKKDILDNQIATALLTGIVSETERFSNNKTTPQTMSVSAKLLTAGANQELVASKLAEPAPVPEDEPEKFDHDDDSASGGGSPLPPSDQPPQSDDGTLAIDHSQQESEHAQTASASELPEEPKLDETSNTKSIELPRAEVPSTPPSGLPADEQAALDLLKDRKIEVDEHGTLQPIETEHRDFLGDNEQPLIGTPSAAPEPEENPAGAPFDLSKFALTPPTMGGTLTANSRPEGLDPSVDPLSASKGAAPILSHDRPGAGSEEPQTPSEPEKPKPENPAEPVVERPAPVAAQESVAPVAPAAETPTSTPPMPPEATATTPAPDPLIAPAFPQAPAPPVAAEASPSPAKTLEDLEKELHSPHVAAASPTAAPEVSAPETPQPAPNDLPNPADLAAPAEEAHPALQAALADADKSAPAPEQAESKAETPTTPGGDLQAAPLSAAEMAPPAPALEPEPQEPTSSKNKEDGPKLEAQTMDMPLPQALNMPAPSTTSSTGSPSASPTAPPPVPPPLMPPPQ